MFLFFLFVLFFLLSHSMASFCFFLKPKALSLGFPLAISFSHYWASSYYYLSSSSYASFPCILTLSPLFPSFFSSIYRSRDSSAFQITLFQISKFGRHSFIYFVFFRFHTLFFFSSIYLYSVFKLLHNLLSNNIHTYSQKQRETPKRSKKAELDKCDNKCWVNI